MRYGAIEQGRADLLVWAMDTLKDLGGNLQASDHEMVKESDSCLIIE